MQCNSRNTMFLICFASGVLSSISPFAAKPTHAELVGLTCYSRVGVVCARFAYQRSSGKGSNCELLKRMAFTVRCNAYNPVAKTVIS
eukprot:2307806-Karenia_brevis.AAC.1